MIRTAAIRTRMVTTRKHDHTTEDQNNSDQTNSDQNTNENKRSRRRGLKDKCHFGRRGKGTPNYFRCFLALRDPIVERKLSLGEVKIHHAERIGGAGKSRRDS